MATETSGGKTAQRHIRLTSHPGQQGLGAGSPAIKWGAATAMERGPVVGSTTNRSQRNVNAVAPRKTRRLVRQPAVPP